MATCNISNCDCAFDDFCCQRDCCFKEFASCGYEDCCLTACGLIYGIPSQAIYVPSCLKCNWGDSCTYSPYAKALYNSVGASYFTVEKCQLLFGSTCPVGCTCPTCPPGPTCTCPTCPSDDCDCDCGGDCCFNGLTCEGTDCQNNVKV